MYENINQQVQVIAIFGLEYKKVRPFKMEWHGREFLIKEVTYTRKYKEGQTIWHVFSGTDGISFFELKYDSYGLKWILGRVSDNDAH